MKFKIIYVLMNIVKIWKIHVYLNLTTTKQSTTKAFFLACTAVWLTSSQYEPSGSRPVSGVWDMASYWLCCRLWEWLVQIQIGEFLEFDGLWVGISPITKGHWQSPCTVLTASLPLGLCKGTVKECSVWGASVGGAGSRGEATMKS